MRFSTHKDSDLSTYFCIIDESEGGISNSSFEQKPHKSHTEGNRGLIGGHLPLENNFDFVYLLKK